MLAENCCYSEYGLMVLTMVRQGLFGELTYAECGYVHDCRGLLFRGDGGLTWRGELARDCAGNWYPTHSLGPVAQWLGINRGDRLVSLTAGRTGNGSLREYVRQRFPEGHAAREIVLKGCDSSSALLRTAKGILIDLRFDVCSPRPVLSTTYHSLQGTKGSFESRSGVNSIYIEGRSKKHTWEPAASYAKEFEHPLCARFRQQAAGTGHGGMDFFPMHEFFAAVRKGGPSPIDCYDAAAWSAVMPLSATSIAQGGACQEFPDFTQGKWEQAIKCHERLPASSAPVSRSASGAGTRTRWRPNG